MAAKDPPPSPIPQVCWRHAGLELYMLGYLTTEEFVAMAESFQQSN